MSGLLWKLNRLKAMNAREILHRVTSFGVQKIEKAAVAHGWAPKSAVRVTSRLLMFSASDNWHSRWQEHYSLEREQLDNLLQGQVGFFGHNPLDIGKPVNWHRDPLTGTIAPLIYGKELNYRDDRLVGNVKILWELGRHQHLIPLAVAYATTGETRYRDAVTAQIEGWIAANPFGLGIHWCSALEPALRLISWAVVHSLIALRDGDEGLFLAVSAPDKLGHAIYQQTWFVRHYLSRYSSANNHLIGELTGIWVACSVFDMGKAGEIWATTAKQELEREAGLQVYADGVNKEQACYYHLWVLEYFLFAWVISARSNSNFSEAFRKRILSMAEFLRAITPEGGVPPQIGDADDGFVARFNVAWPEDAYREVLAAVSAVFESEELAPPLPQKAFWYGFCAGKMLTAQKQRISASTPYPRIFEKGGYAILGGDGVHLVLDTGSLGYPSIAAHGHADALSICIALDNLWWLVDPGTYAYHSDHGWRDYFRGTSAHNTLLIDNCDQSEIGGPFLWLRHANAKLVDYGNNQNVQWVVGEHDGYQHLGAYHVRRIEFDNTLGEIRVIDEVRGTGWHELALHYHFAPDVKLTSILENGPWLATKLDSTRKLELVVDHAWRWDVLRGSDTPKLGWFSAALGIKTPTSTLRGIWQGTLPVRLETKFTVL